MTKLGKRIFLSGMRLSIFCALLAFGFAGRVFSLQAETNKIKIETYLTAQGFDVKQSYKDFIAKQKADAAANKTASSP